MYVGRGSGSKWGNPFSIRDDAVTWATVSLSGKANVKSDLQRGAVYLFKVWRAGQLEDLPLLIRHAIPEGLPDPPDDEEIRRELRGKNQACWCPLDQPCHADVLLELANAGDS